jgi:hypothetical protein
MSDNINVPYFSAKRPTILPGRLARIRQFVTNISSTLRQLSCGGESPFRRYPIFAYRSAQLYDVESFVQDGLKQGISITVSVPRRPGRYPLIVWLKTQLVLAKFCDELHRGWVEAGYAVVVVSLGNCTSQSPEKCSAAADSGDVAVIRDLLCHLQERDEFPFDRIDFETAVFGGTAVGADSARTLADACGGSDSLLPRMGFPNRLVIADGYAQELSEDGLAEISPSNDLIIALPGGGKEGVIRLDFHPFSASGGETGSPLPAISHQVAARHLSLGFLDWAVKRDTTAIEWLERDAGRWLEPVGDLHMADTVQPSRPVAVDRQKRPKITPASTAP